MPFGWDNECPALGVEVAAFAIERHDVTNARFLEFVDAGGYRDAAWWRRRTGSGCSASTSPIRCSGSAHDGRWYWRGMFDLIPLPLSWPVYVSHAEASAYARWRGARLPTEAEFQRAAFGSPAGERALSVGRRRADGRARRVRFLELGSGAGRQRIRRARSAWGVEDLVGNGWEWTSTTFAPFPGFRRWRRTRSTRPTSSTASTSS